MPARSSTSSVKLWPTPDVVLAALGEWAVDQANARPELIALGYFGSYARGDAGFGSDLDLIVIVEHSEVPRMERNRDWPYEHLPVPTDLLIFTADEWRRMTERGGRFAAMVTDEVVWVVGSRPGPAGRGEV